MRKPLLVLASFLAFAGLYVTIVMAELLGRTGAVLYLRNEVGMSVTLLRMAILSVTVLPVAYLFARLLVSWSPESGRAALLWTALAFTLAIGMLQLFVYAPSVLGASLLKVTFATVPLLAVAYRRPPQAAA